MRDAHTMSRIRNRFFALALACAAGSTLHAQATDPACEARGDRAFLAGRPSPLDSLSLTLGGQRVKVCYSRPSARGRVVFGQLVEYGKRWRTGANEPTMLFVSDTLELAGVRLGPGRYILMTVPERDHWTVIVNTTAEPEPARMFDALTEVGRGRAEVQPLAAPVEQFTIRSQADRGEARLLLEWERTRAVIPLRALRRSP
jgi:hypothetical protein